MKYLAIDHDFISVYNIEMAAGRPFNEDLRSDSAMSGIIFNESAAEDFGWSSPDEIIGMEFNRRRTEVIGVVKNFHVSGLQNPVDPLHIVINPRIYNYITLKLNTEDIESTLAFVNSKWEELFPDNALESFFLDTDFDRQYRSESQVSKLFSVFTCLGLFIACLGLFGLSAFIASQRAKEVGIP